MLGINIKAIADAHSLPYRLVGAVIEVESAGDTWAMRYEPGYPYLWSLAAGKPIRWEGHTVPPGFGAPRAATESTELTAQRTSWGAMQVLGAVAREHGYEAPYLSRLCRPVDGVDMGCRHLATLRRRHGTGDDLEALAAAYNAGSPRRKTAGQWVNQGYVDKIREAGGFR